MKRIVAVLAASLAAVSIYAVTAPAGPETVSPKRVAALEKKVTSLQRSVNRLNHCFATATPVTQYPGYLYQPPGTTSVVATTAIDVTAQGGQIGALFVGTSADCVSALHLKTGSLPARHAYRK
jgi:hypothetical protein